MSNTRLEHFRNLITDRFTAVAVEIFGEFESIVEAYYQENTHLRSILHMVLSPSIKLSKIDVTRYTGPTQDVREHPPLPKSSGVDVEMSEPRLKIPKVEQTECDISWKAEAQDVRGESAGNLIPTDCIKKDPEDQVVSIPHVRDSAQLQDGKSSSSSSSSSSTSGGFSTPLSAINSDKETKASGYLHAAKGCPALFYIEEIPNEQLGHKKRKTKKKRSKKLLQKTMLEFPRMKPLGSAGSADSQSFLERLTAAFKDIPDDKKPLITKLGLTKNRGVGTVNCAFGKAPKRRPVSSQRHVQSSRDYKMYDDAPPRPLIPLNRFKLEPVANLPTLSAEEQRHVDVLMELTWETAYNVEQVTCRHRESIARFQKLRLTNHFREICTLRPGQSNVEHLLFKIKKEEQTCKSTQMKEDLKGEALQLYCRNMSTNWYLCGLVLHPSAPWLGALPDGLVYDPNEVPNFGLVHVKWTRQESFVKSKYLICKDGVLHLKKTNSLYWQVQGEMMVTGTSWCDLLLLSEKDILIQRIYRDRRIIKDMKKKLDDFFFYFYLPRALQ